MAYHPKNAKAHLVHLSERVWEIIKTQPQHGRFVFATAGRKNFQSFKFAKKNLDRLSGVTEWRTHDLRRTVVTGMARLGVPPHVFRNAVVDGSETTLRVNNCLADHRAAWQLDF